MSSEDESLTSRRGLLRIGLAVVGSHPLIQKAYAAGVPHYITAEGQRPQAKWGVMTSEVSRGSVVIWSRVDRPSEMVVRWSLDPDFNATETTSPVLALPDTDLTARVVLTSLPAGRRIFYMVYFESLVHSGVRSLPLFGELSTPPSSPLDPVRLAWSGDSFGQGYGINPQWGGVLLYDKIREASPDLFVHCGDRIYADQPLKPMKGGGKGRRWYNLTTPWVEKVAEELDDFRGYYRYGLMDEPTRRFAQTTSQLFLWDDHEVKNDWWPGRVLKDRRYREKSCDRLAERAKRAFFEYSPLPMSWTEHQRIYRGVSLGPNLDLFALDSRSARGPNDYESHRLIDYQPRTQFFGPAQLGWLKESLKSSRAKWKVIACPQPLGIIIGSQDNHFDGIASPELQPKGRELELADLLSFIKRERIKNVVWVSADVHYAAAHHFHPDRAVFTDFIPFWEFIAGPINAATMRAHRLDKTFGPDRVYLSVPEGRSGGGLSPLEGEQYFGLLDLPSGGEELNVSIVNLAGERVYSERLFAEQ